MFPDEIGQHPHPCLDLYIVELGLAILAINFMHVGGVFVRQCSALFFPFVCRPAGQVSVPLLYLFPISITLYLLGCQACPLLFVPCHFLLTLPHRQP